MMINNRTDSDIHRTQTGGHGARDIERENLQLQFVRVPTHLARCRLRRVPKTLVVRFTLVLVLMHSTAA